MKKSIDKTDKFGFEQSINNLKNDYKMALGKSKSLKEKFACWIDYMKMHRTLKKAQKIVTKIESKPDLIDDMGNFDFDKISK